jgi:hypothetical protein
MKELLYDNNLKIISGGQSGVDRAALDIAIESGFDYGGFCPKGRRAEDGVVDEKYRLTETRSDRYYLRTMRNIKHSNATIIIYSAKMGRGTAVTRKYCKNLKKRYLVINSKSGFSLNQSKIYSFILKHNIKTLNIAGDRESSSPGIYDYTLKLLKEVFTRLNTNHEKSINS